MSRTSLLCKSISFTPPKNSTKGNRARGGAQVSVTQFKIIACSYPWFRVVNAKVVASHPVRYSGVSCRSPTARSSTSSTTAPTTSRSGSRRHGRITRGVRLLTATFSTTQRLSRHDCSMAALEMRFPHHLHSPPTGVAVVVDGCCCCCILGEGWGWCAP